MLIPSSPSPNVEPPPQSAQLALRIAVLGGVSLVLFGVLVFRLWAVQVLASPTYQVQAQQNLVQHVTQPAARGWILDDRGRALVRNRSALEVQVDTVRLHTAASRFVVLGRLAGVLGTTRRKLERSVEQQQRWHPLEPATLARDVDRPTALYLGENQIRFPGVSVVPEPVRWYPRGDLGAHLYGSLAPIGAAQLADKRDFGCYQPPNHCYQGGDIIGLRGVEGHYDRWLRGLDGRLNVTVDASGTPRGPAIPRPAAQAGYNLRLTIDVRTQRDAQAALSRGVRRASPAGAQTGAMVVLDPRTGAIRALASYPSFNPNWEVSSAKRYRWGRNFVARSPLAPAWNRAISGEYAPGSTIKPFIAAAAMQTGLVGATTDLTCSGSFSIGGHTFNNWNQFIDTPMSLPTALEQSCDTYFYRLGAMFYRLPRADGHPEQSWLARFGFGRDSGIDLAGESGGLLPTPAWKHGIFKNPRSWDYSWHPGDSVLLSIGQGFLRVTPLQLAAAYAAIANGGELVRPHVAQDAELADGSVVQTFGRTVRHSVGVSATALAAIRDGLERVTHDPNGTAYQVFGSFPIDVAGKTGTAQVPPHPDDSLFASYAPASNPQLVVVVIIQGGGHGGTAAAPTAADFYCHYFRVTCPSFTSLTDQSR